MKRLFSGAAVALAAAALLVAPASPASADPVGDLTYTACQSSQNRDVQNSYGDLKVVCTEFPAYSGDWKWYPVLKPDPAITAPEYAECSVPGLVSRTPGGYTAQTCVRAWDGLYFF